LARSFHSHDKENKRRFHAGDEVNQTRNSKTTVAYEERTTENQEKMGERNHESVIGGENILFTGRREGGPHHP